MRTRDTGILIVLLSGEGKSRADIELAEIQESGKSGTVEEVMRGR